MTQALQAPDRWVRTAPLGVGFSDLVTGALVTDGLVVTLRPPRVTDRELRAAQNASGIHVFHALPGITGLQSPANSGNAGGTVAARRFRFEVVDENERFQPFSFDADCPAPGLFVPACLQASPPLNRYVPLFSSVTRLAPPGMAVVRIELRDGTTRRPAAWVLLTVELEGRELGRGLSDRDGKAILIFPFPEPAIASPPASMPWRWPLRLHAFYTPVAAAPALPSLCTVLSQAPARLLADTSPPVELSAVELEYGRELVVTSGPESHLLIEPA